MRCREEWNNLFGKKVLIAGGTGFIGKIAVKELNNLGVHTFVLTRRDLCDTENIRYIKCDLEKSDELEHCCKEEQFDDAIYMAAHIPTIGEKKETLRDAKCSTLDPFVNFCNFFLKKVNSLIYISSVDVLGRCSTYEYNESAPMEYTTPYGLAKYCGELYAQNYCNVQNIPCKIFRFSQVYGPNEPIVRIIPILKDKLVKNQEFTLYTNGEEKRRFLYVDDAVQAIICGLLTIREGIYNIAGPEVISMLDLIQRMEDIWGKKLDLKILNKTEGWDNVPSIMKAVMELGFKPWVGIEEGLKIIKKVELNNGR